MTKLKAYIIGAQICGFMGIGMVFGGVLGEGESKTPYWVGGILIFIAAMFIGMSISTRQGSKSSEAED